MEKCSEQKGRQCALVLFMRLPADTDPELVVIVYGSHCPDVHHVSIGIVRDDWPV